MPNFRSWGMQNEQFGAFVELNPSVFKAQPDGRVLVEKASPRTEFFGKDKIERLAEIAGPNTKPFWQQMQDVFPKQEALYTNSRDIASEAISKAAAPAQGLDLSNKQTFQV